MLRLLSRRFGGAASEGTILANAVKGLGKSHALLLAYHLLKSPTEATAWMTKLGYVFLKSGFSHTRLKNLDRVLNGKRFRFHEENETLPERTPGLWLDESRRLTVLAGRGHNRPQAPSASQSVYRHGGLTLMEMLTAWLVLGPVGSA